MYASMNIIREGKVTSWGYGRGARMDDRLATESDYHLPLPVLERVGVKA